MIKHAIITVSVVPRGKKVVVSAVDITDKKEIEEKLKESEERYRAIFENAPLGILIMSLDGTIVDCNKVVLENLGMKKEEIVGRKWFGLNIFDPAELPKIMRLYHQGLQRGVWEVQELKVKIHGEVRYLRLFPTLLKIDNSPYAIMVILEDVTKEVVAERQIENNIEQFAILVDQIRNPLSAAQGFVEIYVENEDIKRKIKEQLDRIVKVIERIEKGWIDSEKIREFLRREGLRYE